MTGLNAKRGDWAFDTVIETEQAVRIAVPIEKVWNYARDVRRWAEIMPGYQSCEIEDEDNSRWVLKIGVGAMVRTVKVRVHVDEWAGPERVRFTFRLDGDPVNGGGSYEAVAAGDVTDVALRVHVSGSVPMGPMCQALRGPVLPKFAAGFAGQLRDRIEAECGVSQAAGAAVASLPRPGPLARLVAWLRTLFSR